LISYIWYNNTFIIIIQIITFIKYTNPWLYKFDILKTFIIAHGKLPYISNTKCKETLALASWYNRYKKNYNDKIMLPENRILWEEARNSNLYHGYFK
jgi:hypothetical protein